MVNTNQRPPSSSTNPPSVNKNQRPPPSSSTNSTMDDDDVNSPNHPLFLHQQDHSGLVLISKKLTRSGNYGSWKRSMMIALNAKNKMKIINGNLQNQRINGERDLKKRLVQFLMGLDECYANIRGQILLMNPMPTVAKAYSMIRNSYNNNDRGGRNYNQEMSARIDQLHNLLNQMMLMMQNNKDMAGTQPFNVAVSKLGTHLPLSILFTPFSCYFQDHHRRIAHGSLCN
uniref:Reverse transcriptase, RNA-dependent DNA polymerase, Gag-polypeptide of LTR copia-type n=1 Tax=Tanacetum cinerariifolium TaxID=118510 RepID=A0A699ISD2_TANCI|nr:reverse transcriptase, RNA-dependent DNA polymerase, Gag-polypeptide of LTR copia-type [Tanacetum cinerariifolium]